MTFKRFMSTSLTIDEVVNHTEVAAWSECGAGRGGAAVAIARRLGTVDAETMG